MDAQQPHRRCDRSRPRIFTGVGAAQAATTLRQQPRNRGHRGEYGALRMAAQWLPMRGRGSRRSYS
ncbi:hypothetical protein GLA29479_3483 [Lysobacter antibioticus]|nr:hypothetical protein GLA29479_3483 [Lysobacter antibioticus]